MRTLEKMMYTNIHYTELQIEMEICYIFFKQSIMFEYALPENIRIILDKASTNSYKSQIDFLILNKK